jgi:hypothetical protein
MSATEVATKINRLLMPMIAAQLGIPGRYLPEFKIGPARWPNQGISQVMACYEDSGKQILYKGDARPRPCSEEKEYSHDELNAIAAAVGFSHYAT